MAGLKVEGNLDGVSDIQQKYIRDVIDKQGFTDASVVFEPVGKAGDNYMANVKRITIQGKDGNTLKMIAKLAPNQEALRTLLNVGVGFKNEHIMYSKVLPKLEQVAMKADIAKEERLKFAACYGSFDEAPHEVILLEDLNVSGFVMLDRFQFLNDACVRSVLKNLAILHSFSFALKYKEPAVFNEFRNDLVDMWTQISVLENMKLYFGQLKENILMCLENDDHKKVVHDVIPGGFVSAVRILKTDQESKHAIIQQGDAWTNNIMFKIEEGNPLASIIIDYQISKASNPVMDLLFMIFNCTDYKTRKQHFHDWIDYYHNELDKSLSNFGLKVNYVYPKDQLDADLRRYGRLNLGLCIVLASMLVLKPEEASRVKEAMESINIEEKQKTSELSWLDADSIALFKSRVEGLLNSFIELGLVKL